MSDLLKMNVVYLAKDSSEFGQKHNKLVFVLVREWLRYLQQDTPIDLWTKVKDTATLVIKKQHSSSKNLTWTEKEEVADKISTVILQPTCDIKFSSWKHDPTIGIIPLMNNAQVLEFEEEKSMTIVIISPGCDYEVHWEESDRILTISITPIESFCSIIGVARQIQNNRIRDDGISLPLFSEEKFHIPAKFDVDDLTSEVNAGFMKITLPTKQKGKQLIQLNKVKK